MYNTLRLTGLASGIDTEEMVQSMMQAERIKVDRVEQSKQTLLWRQEIYNDLNKSFANFILNTRKMFGLTEVTRTGNFKTNAYQDLNWVKKATSSDEKIATVSSTSKVLDGNYKVKVDKLAEGVNMASASEIGDMEGLLDENGEVTRAFKFTINDGGEYDFTIEVEEGNTFDDIVKKINNANITIKEGKEDKKVSINIRASYDRNNKRFFLQTTNTGKDAQIKIDADGDGESFINALNLTTGKKSYKANDDAIIGQDAEINFNGADGIKSSTNRITINGITMDLKAEGEFNIIVATDVDGIYEKIEQFVNDYNELVDKTNKLLGEKQYRDYPPLTAEQKKAMEKEDIEIWEEKAKSGILRNDSIIQSTMLKVRQSLYEGFKVEDGFSGAFNLITEIGIGTEEYSRGTAGGRLKINEKKLKEKIAENPEGVMELLFKESTPATKNDDGTYNDDGISGGILARIHDGLMVGMEEIVKKSGTGENADLYRGVKGNILLDFVTEYSSISLLDKDVLQFNRRIDDLNVMLLRKENSYYAKFAAMEKAINKMNQQSSWLMQQFMG